jgi:single-strand DNA-binding protein
LVTTKEEILSLNNVTLVGRVGGEPNVRYFESGSVVCNLTLAVNRSSKKEEDPDWFNLEIWGRTAQAAADYVKKGSQIGISGNLKMEYWSDKSTGASRSKPVVRVNRLDLLGSKRDTEAAAGAGGGGDFDEF